MPVKDFGIVTILERKSNAGIGEREFSRFHSDSSRWCSGGDSNPYTFRHTPLKRTCLPIPPPEPGPFPV